MSFQNDKMYYPKGLIYLACPYTHKSKTVMKGRFKKVSKVAGTLINAGNLVYSPMSHGAPIGYEANLPNFYDYWAELDEYFIRSSDILMILQLEGWEESYGISQEMKYAKDMDLPIVFLPDYL